jgi:hypothetical protein
MAISIKELLPGETRRHDRRPYPLVFHSLKVASNNHHVPLNESFQVPMSVGGEAILVS